MEIVLFTDFGTADIYVGQVKSVLHRLAPGATVIDLAHDLEAFNIRAAAHILDALKGRFSEGSVFMCVIDPGVGGTRLPVVLQADGRHFVGPDNGLLSVVAARAAKKRYWRVVWRPAQLSDSFHGRDLFAPIAAQIAAATLRADQIQTLVALEVDFGADDLRQIIYVDHYGNACTGIRSVNASDEKILLTKGHRIDGARVFGDVPPSHLLWYVNSHGLVEIAMNRGNAARTLGLQIGDPVDWAD